MPSTLGQEVYRETRQNKNSEAYIEYSTHKSVISKIEKVSKGRHQNRRTVQYSTLQNWKNSDIDSRIKEDRRGLLQNRERTERTRKKEEVRGRLKNKESPKMSQKWILEQRKASEVFFYFIADKTEEHFRLRFQMRKTYIEESHRWQLYNKGRPQRSALEQKNFSEVVSRIGAKAQVGFRIKEELRGRLF